MPEQLGSPTPTPVALEHEHFDSHLITQAIYNPMAAELVVIYSRTGAVSLQEWEDMRAAGKTGSVGSWFSINIKPWKQYKKL